ncbi:hypothetical protein K504DRAFT_372571 [Pleomassaria siparia CBS 279.74]|uniref:Mitochondrial adapter protein MCP1 transmembrane domain-containing protein n=1 Tax=Pleomassaria siparia CBS 279.74 TaxID=1314801 RepID=A0A6G1KJ42_9PLEO|nr:hypothetical protein K504DRAFT_372571 [Pleomassaria siparia CBS 279.74]
MSDDLPPMPEDGESVIGLLEVEPSPVEDEYFEFKDGSYFESSSPSPTPSWQPSRTSTLGLGNHRPSYYLLRIQKYTSYAFTVFSTLHIANTSLIPLLTRSVSESNRYLLLTRPFYQSALTEPLLVAIPLLAHVSSGIALRFYRRHQALRRYGAESHQDRRKIPWPPFSGTSLLGYALLPFAGFHIWTTRILPLYMHGDSSMIGLGYISHGFALHPAVSFAGFAALVSAGVWHTTWGWARWLGLAPTQTTETGSQRSITKKRRWYNINGVAALVTGLWLAGSLGIIGRGGKTDGWIGREFDDLYKVVSLIGKLNKLYV